MCPSAKSQTRANEENSMPHFNGRVKQANPGHRKSQGSFEPHMGD